MCGSVRQKVFMAVAAIAMVIYYPVATFLYPNLQFIDDGDDLKYEPTFIVVETQAKLLIAGMPFLAQNDININHC